IIKVHAEPLFSYHLLTGAGYCASLMAGDIDGNVVGGGGGFSAHYARPSYQSGTPGLSATALCARGRISPSLPPTASGIMKLSSAIPAIPQLHAPRPPPLKARAERPLPP